MLVNKVVNSKKIVAGVVIASTLLTNSVSFADTKFMPGDISAKYETGVKSTGKSMYKVQNYTIYGRHYSLTSDSKDKFYVGGFVDWFVKKNPKYKNQFKNLTPGTTKFNNAWKSVYDSEKDKFEQAQKEYLFDKAVKPVITQIKKSKNIDFNKSKALQELIFSTVIQYGEKKTTQIVENAGINKNSSDKKIITNVQSQKQSLAKKTYSSKVVLTSVINRINAEKEDFLKLVK